MRDWQIEASAPGKIVLSGEYAVLAGAPALVATVARRVICRLAVRRAGGWRFTGQGVAYDQTLPKAAVFRAPATTIAGVARQAIPADAAPEHLQVFVDSSACHLGGQKLGIGGSAATVTAVAAALGALRDKVPSLARLIDIHTAFQGGGSGLDVAAAFTGGVIRYQNRRVDRLRLPRGLAHLAVYCGEGTATAGRLAAFNAWRGSGTPAALRRLVDAAEAAVAGIGDATTFVARFADYGAALARFDRDAKLDIFGARHKRVAELASCAGVRYKPCGAGGNDIGLALATDEQAMTHFEGVVGTVGVSARQGFEPIGLRLADVGLRVRRRALGDDIAQ